MKLFGREIVVTFLGTGFFDTIDATGTGLKPDISVTGRLEHGTIAGNVTITVRNFYPQRKIDKYRKAICNITMGYKGELKKLSITGQVFYAYYASANPNGECVFVVNIGKWSETIDGNINFNMLNSLDAILALVAAKLKIPFVNVATKRVTSVPVAFSGKIIDLLNSLSRYFEGTQVSIMNNTIYAYNKGTGITILPATEIKYFLNPPVFSGGGVSFDCLLSAGTLPGMRVKVGSNIGIQDIASSLRGIAGSFKTYCVTAVDFAFGSIQQVNNMTIQAVG